MAYTKASKLTITGGFVKDTSNNDLINIKLLGMYISQNPLWYFNPLVDPPFNPPNFVIPSFFMTADNITRITLRDGGSTGEIIYANTFTNTGGVTDDAQISFGPGITCSGKIYLDGLSTTLTANITDDATTIPVSSAVDFPTAGGILIDSESMMHYSHTNNAFILPPQPSSVIYTPVFKFIPNSRSWQSWPPTTGAVAHSIGATVHQIIGYITFFYEQL